MKASKNLTFSLVCENTVATCVHKFTVTHMVLSMAWWNPGPLPAKGEMG